MPLDEDTEHSRYDAGAVERYFAVATQAAIALAAFRAPYRGRSTPVNAWWGSFDLAVNLFSGAPADPPSGDFIMRNAMDAEEVAIGWWPGDGRYERAAFYAYAHPAPDTFPGATLRPDSCPLGPSARGVRARLGRRSLLRGSARTGTRVRELGFSPRVRDLRVGPASARERGGLTPSGQLKSAAPWQGWRGGGKARSLSQTEHPCPVLPPW